MNAKVLMLAVFSSAAGLALIAGPAAAQADQPEEVNCVGNFNEKKGEVSGYCDPGVKTGKGNYLVNLAKLDFNQLFGGSDKTPIQKFECTAVEKAGKPDPKIKKSPTTFSGCKKTS